MQYGRRQKIFYRLAIQQGRDPLDQPAGWQWKSTVLSSLESMFQVLRLYRYLPQEELRVFSSPSREGLEEQLRQENSGVGSASVTAARFLRKHLINSIGVTSASEAHGRQERTSSTAVATAQLDERGLAASVPGEQSMSSLERRRLELELGPGSDHDVPYCFTLPLSMPQALAWMRLLASRERGELPS